jgi:hypothetical protein
MWWVWFYKLYLTDPGGVALYFFFSANDFVFLCQNKNKNKASFYSKLQTTTKFFLVLIKLLKGVCFEFATKKFLFERTL